MTLNKEQPCKDKWVHVIWCFSRVPLPVGMRCSSLEISAVLPCLLIAISCATLSLPSFLHASPIGTHSMCMLHKIRMPSRVSNRDPLHLAWITIAWSLGMQCQSMAWHISNMGVHGLSNSSKCAWWLGKAHSALLSALRRLKATGAVPP